MRKHISLFYKSYDGLASSKKEIYEEECMNDYGYNFDGNPRRMKNLDCATKHTHYGQKK